MASVLAFATNVAGRNSYFRNLSEVGKLGDMTVSSIVSDTLGYVWLGTRQGVERFDGMRLENYPLPWIDGKASAVKALCPYGEGSVVAGKNDGLWLVDPTAGTATHLDGLDIVGVTSIVRYSGDSLLVGGRDGLYCFDVSAETFERIPLGIAAGSPPTVTDITRSDSVCRVATEKEIVQLEMPSLSSAGPGYSVEGKIRQIVASGHKLYVGTHERGLIVIDMRDGSRRNVDIGCNIVTSLETDADGCLHVGTDGAGIVVVDTRDDSVKERIVHSMADESSIHSNSIYSLHVDGRGLIWAGFYQLGADYTLYQNDLFEVFGEPYFDTRGVNVRVAAIDGDRIVLGTRDGLVVVDRGKMTVKRISSPELRSNLVISLLIDGDSVMAGTYGGGMSKVNLSTGRVTTPITGGPFVDGHVFTMSRNPSTGDIWAGTSSGLYRKRGDELRHYHYGNSHVPDGNVYTVFFDSKGRGWVGTATGLAIIDPRDETIRTDMFPADFFYKEDIRSIYETADGKLYFLPDKGLPYFADLELKTFGHIGEGVLDGRDMKSVVSDSTGALWLATNNGMVRWDGAGEWREYGFADGIPSPIFNTFQPTIDADGSIWIGNTKGLLRLGGQGRSHGSTAVSPVPSVTRVIVKGNPLERPSGGRVDEIVLPSGVNDVEMEVSTFAYTSPECMEVEYMLEGVDSEWRHTGVEGTITYYDLPGGAHKLHLRDKSRPESASVTRIVVSRGRSRAAIVIAVIAVLLVVAAPWLWINVKERRRKAREEETRRLQQLVTTAGSGAADRVKYKSNRVNIGECEAISRALERVMERERPYVNPELALADLAKMIDVSTHKMSFYFSQYLHQSYYDYINELRIKEFKRMASGSEGSRYTLSGLSAKAGFSSRASFFRYFKKIEGITPAQYMKELGK